MQNKHVTFDEIYDILAVRIIFTPKVRANEVNECFSHLRSHQQNLQEPSLTVYATG